MKIFLLFSVLILSTVAVKAQSETDLVLTTNSEEEIIKLEEKGLAILEMRILTANLPDDLLTRALDVLLNTQIQFDSCKAALHNIIIWQYKVCMITQLKIANIAIKLLENEANERLTTTTTSPTNL